MRRIWLIAAVIGGLGAPALGEVRGADQPATPAVPPASGTSSSDLSHSGGVVKPPDGVDPAMKRIPPPSGARMPVMPRPGTPGGDRIRQAEIAGSGYVYRCNSTCAVAPPVALRQPNPRHTRHPTLSP